MSEGDDIYIQSYRYVQICSISTFQLLKSGQQAGIVLILSEASPVIKIK